MLKFTKTTDKLTGGNLLPYLFAWLISGAILGSTLVVFWMSFKPGLSFGPDLTILNYAEVFDSALFTQIIPNTLVVGVGTVAIALFFGVILAWLLNRTDVPFRSLSITLLGVSAIVPSLVKVMGWILLLSPRIGWINQFIMRLFNLQTAPLDIFSLWGIVFVQGLTLAPVLFFLLSGPMRSMDPVLEEAAALAGAGPWKTLIRVTWPLIRPAVFGGVIYVFITAISMFEVASLLGGLGKHPVLSTKLFLSVYPGYGIGGQSNYGIAGVYAVLMAVPNLVAMYFYFQMIEKAYRYAVIGGKSYRPKSFRLGKYRYLGFVFIFFYTALAAFLPLLILLWLSLLPSVRMPSREALSLVTFEWYTDIILVMGGYRVVNNTILLVLASSFLVLFFSFMVSWIVVRTRLPSRRILDMIAMLPHAIPGIAFAFALFIIGLLLARYLPWLPFYNTVWIMITASVLTRLSYATRATNAALIQIHKELEDAALICGARRWTVMWRVMAPVISPSLVFTGLWTALLVFREVSIPLMLQGADNKVVATQIWALWFTGHASQAAAVSIILVLTLALILLVIQRVSKLEGDKTEFLAR